MSLVRDPALTIDHAVRRFAVAWRHRPRRFIAPVGVLDFDATEYRFEYLPRARSLDDFKPFVGFPNLEHLYVSPRLWPFFGLRVMDRQRPDFNQYVRWLGLDADASRLDILSRSAGEQKGDSVFVIEEPPVAQDGTTGSTFLVRGVRYAGPTTGPSAAVDALRAGAELDLVDDTTNEVNPSALAVETSDGLRVGWVPDLLIGYARVLRDAGGVVTVVQNNGPDAPWHMRLLVHIGGRAPVGPGTFSGEGWPRRYSR